MVGRVVQLLGLDADLHLRARGAGKALQRLHALEALHGDHVECDEAAARLHLVHLQARRRRNQLLARRQLHRLSAGAASLQDHRLPALCAHYLPHCTSLHRALTHEQLLLLGLALLLHSCTQYIHTRALTLCATRMWK